MLAKRGELFGAWDSEWVFKFEELKAEPKQIPKGIEILLKVAFSLYNMAMVYFFFFFFLVENKSDDVEKLSSGG